MVQIMSMNKNEHKLLYHFPISPELYGVLLLHRHVNYLCPPHRHVNYGVRYIGQCTLKHLTLIFHTNSDVAPLTYIHAINLRI